MIPVKQAIEKINSYNWEIRVTRAGYIQSKQIVCEAIIIPLELCSGVTVSNNNNLWIQDLALYDDQGVKSVTSTFDKAFSKDINWPKRMVENLDKSILAINEFIQGLKELESKISKSEKIALLEKYSSSLKEVQKYYVIAVPLTNYAELQLTDKGIDAARFGFSIKPLDISKISSSENPAKDYAWIKTAYNLIEELNEDDINHLRIEHDREEIEFPKNIKKTDDIMIAALQSGIYLRNRMKEVSQQIWYYYDNLAKLIAKDLHITKEDYYCLTIEEVIKSIHAGELIVSAKEINNRKQCFVVGVIDRTNVMVSGIIAKKLLAKFQQSSKESSITGRIACKGSAEGIARVIFNQKQASNLNKGDILVTTMTTPDFVVLLKKAAAIITDEGGLSCHAAIVSREMNIPCIIGTKNATKSIKDGDYIEVDANKGIVKILKRKTDA